MANFGLNFFEKSQLRKRMRDQLTSLDQTERNRRSLAICHKLSRHFAGIQSIALFASTMIEPNLDLLWELRLLKGKRLFYPKCGREEMQFFESGSPIELQSGRFGIREPRKVIISTIPDLIVVPGLAFTPDGRRLGRGAGFYDRFLANLPTRTCKIGVCFDFQIVAEIACEKHDIPVDKIVTA